MKSLSKTCLRFESFDRRKSCFHSEFDMLLVSITRLIIFNFFSLFYLTSLNLFLFSLVLSFKYFFTRQKVPCSHWSFGSPISLRFLYWVSEQICDHDIALDRNPSLFTAFFRGCRNSRYCWLSSWVVVIYQFFFASTCTFAFSLYSNQLNWIKRFIKFILYSVCFKCLISKQLN